MMDARRYRDFPRYREREQEVQEVQEEEHRMLPCRFFVNGFCVQGGRCRFYHPSPAFLPTAMRVPPFPSDFCSTPRMGGGNSLHYPQSSSPASSTYMGDQDATMNSRNSSFEDTRHDDLDFGFDNNNYYNNMVGEEGDAPRTPKVRFLNGVTSTYENGLVSFQYPNGGRQSTFVYEEDEEVPISPSPSKSQTLFTHINWNEFLLPGKSPPPYVAVPLEETEKPRRGKCFLDLTKLLEKEASPPEENVEQKKLTAKEELHLKVQLIAQELEKETVNVPKIRSLDSFFQNYENLENLPAAMIIRNPEPTQANGSTNNEKSTNEQLTDTDDGPCTSDEGRTYSDDENIPPV